MTGTYRDLLYLGQPMDVAIFVARSGERGYIGYTVTIYTANTEYVTCECPAKKGSCWHVKEAPKALFYVQQREKFKAMDAAAFVAFFGEWWPRYQQATGEEAYLGKSKEDWDVWFAALLDERNERDKYTRKYIGQVREMFDAVEVTE